MGTASDGNNVVLGSAKVEFDRLDSNGYRTGFRLVGNCTKVELSRTSEAKEIFNSASAARERLKKVTIRSAWDLSIAMSEFQKENAALALMADNSTFAQTAATSTDEAILTTATSALDRSYYFAKKRVTSITNVKYHATTLGSATTATAVTDYAADYAADASINGFYIPPTATAAIAAKMLWATYIYPTLTLQTVRGGVSGTIEGAWRITSDNTTGPEYLLEIWSSSLEPDSAFGFITDDFSNVGIKAAVQADATNHPTEPSFRLTYSP